MSKLHKKTGSACMLCDSTENIIIFHKTRRQTHGLCVDCGVGYLKPILAQTTNNVRKNIRHRSEIIKCPGSIYSEHRNLCKHECSLLYLVIPDCDISLDFFRLTYVLQNNNTFICPEMKCGQVVEVDPAYISNKLVCHGGCNTSWCRDCLTSPFHAGKSCIEVEADNKNTENGKHIWDLKSEGKLKFCPQCRAPCIKHNGCNKMVCGSCHRKWCWLCMTPDIGYDHYNSVGVGACTGKLWQGVDEDGNAILEGNDEQGNNAGAFNELLNPPQPRRQFPIGFPHIQYRGAYIPYH